MAHNDMKGHPHDKNKKKGMDETGSEERDTGTAGGMDDSRSFSDLDIDPDEF